MINHTTYLWKDWLSAESQKQYRENGCYSQKLKLSNGKMLDKVNVVVYNS